MPPDRSDTDEPLEDRVPAPPFPLSCDDIVPFISFDLTISCFASLLFVPGFVRLIFIFSPLSTVAECSTAILPGLPGFPCAALTLPTTKALLCFEAVPATIAGQPFAFPVPLLPTLFTILAFPLAGLFDRPVEFNTQAEDTDDKVDDDTVDEDKQEDDDDDDDDNDEDNDEEEETEEVEEEDDDDDDDEFDD